MDAYGSNSARWLLADVGDYRRSESNDVVDHIHSNLHRNLGVAEIARVAFISPYYFGLPVAK